MTGFGLMDGMLALLGPYGPGAALAAPPRGRLGRLLERLLAADTAAVWLERLRSHGVPCNVGSGCR